MLGTLQKARAEGDQETGIWVLAGMWRPDDWVLRCRLRCRGGGRRSRWPVPRGRVWASWVPGGGSPPRLVPSHWKASCPIPYRQLGCPHCPEGRLRFQTSAFPRVARSNSFILGEQSARRPSSIMGLALLPWGEGRQYVPWARHPLPGCFLCNRGSFLPLTPRVLFFGL